MAKRIDLAPLLSWRSSKVGVSTPESLTRFLSVERLPYDDVPPRFMPLLIAFRRLRTDARIAACRRWMVLHTMTARSKQCGHRTAMWYRIDGGLTEHHRSNEDIHLRCQSCGAIVPFGPSNDTPDEAQDELIAIEVAAGERAAFGQTSGAFRVGRNEAHDPDGWYSVGHGASWLRQYQSGALAAHLETEADGGGR